VLPCTANAMIIVSLLTINGSFCNVAVVVMVIVSRHPIRQAYTIIIDCPFQLMKQIYRMVQNISPKQLSIFVGQSNYSYIRNNKRMKMTVALTCKGFRLHENASQSWFHQQLRFVQEYWWIYSPKPGIFEKCTQIDMDDAVVIVVMEMGMIMMGMIMVMRMSVLGRFPVGFLAGA
jgi:hypothetical protein